MRHANWIPLVIAACAYGSEPVPSTRTVHVDCSAYSTDLAGFEVKIMAGDVIVGGRRLMQPIPAGTEPKVFLFDVFAGIANGTYSLWARVISVSGLESDWAGPFEIVKNWDTPDAPSNTELNE